MFSSLIIDFIIVFCADLDATITSNHATTPAAQLTPAPTLYTTTTYTAAAATAANGTT